MTPPASSAASAPRPAATVIALADDAHGSAPSLLMVRRSARSPFMPDALVFPGGRVEAEDGPAGSDAAFERAARREAMEEAALDLGDVPLRWFDTWTTPSREGRRFEARFFLARVDAAAMAHTTPDGHETTDGIWDTARGFLSRWSAGEFDLPPPTICVLYDLATQLHALEQRAATDAAGTILPRLQALADTVAIVLPHAAPYPDLEGDHAPAPARAAHLPHRFLRKDGRWCPEPELQLP